MDALEMKLILGKQFCVCRIKAQQGLLELE